MVIFDDNEIQQISTIYNSRKEDKKLEFEIVFGSISKNLGGISNQISQSQFINLLKKIKNMSNKGELNVLPSSTSLDINIHKTNDINENNRFNLRFTINGKNDISTFCSNNTLNNIDYEVLYKKNKGYVDISNYGIRYNLKQEDLYHKKNKRFSHSNAREEWKRYTQYLLQHNNKFSQLYKTFRLKNRYSFKSLDGAIRYDLTIVRSSREELDNNGRYVQKPVKEFIHSMLLEQKKTYEVELELFPNQEIEYDYDNYVDEINKHIDIILTGLTKYPHIISKKETNDIQYIYQQFLNNQFLNTIYSKLSILGNDIKRYNTAQKEEATKIKQSFSDISYFNQVVDTKNNIDSVIKNLKDRQTKIKKGYYPYQLNNKIYQISPKPVSMEMSNIQHGTKKSMIDDVVYSVTDKADGLSMLLYVVGVNHLSEDNKSKYNHYLGNIYLIDSNLVIYSTGLKVSKSTYYNTLINGEYIDTGINHNSISLFRSYDIYVHNSNSTLLLPLLSINKEDKTRISIIKNIVENIVEDLSYYGGDYDEENSLTLKIGVKDFLIGKGDELFKQSNQIWNTFKNGFSEYKYDGLIYTPIKYPVGYRLDKLNFDLDLGQTWFMNIKWKPEYENTIDFLVKELKEEVSSYEFSKIQRSKIGFIQSKEDRSVYNSYKTYYLEVGQNEDTFDNHCEDQLDGKVKTKSKNKHSRYLSKPFIPNMPYDENAYVAKLMMNSSMNEVVGNEWNMEIDMGVLENNGNWEHTTDIIRDDTIVEFSYQQYDSSDPRYIKDKEFRWIPLRTREDKTYQYKLGVKKQKELYKLLIKFINVSIENPNKQLSKVEFNQLHSLKDIINNVPGVELMNTRDIQSVLKTISTNSKQIKNYYPDYTFIQSRNIKIVYGNDFNTANNIWRTIHNPITEKMITTGENISHDIDSNDKYYRNDVSKMREKSLTITLQHFHNKVVKDISLIKKVVDKLRLDGMDNIRLLDLATGKGGDISKWIHNDIKSVVGVDLVRDNIYNTIDGACVRRKNLLKNREMDITFMVGDISKNIKNGDSFNDLISTKLWESGRLSMPFDIISCMFAIHYVFNSEENLDNLINNIDENLKYGGYFIGTCLDGQMVFDLFKRKIYNDYVVGTKNDKIIWKLKKLYIDTEFTNNKDSLNMKIGVFMNSINQEIYEYLVNFEYLVQKLKEKHIILLSSELSRNMNLPMDHLGKYKSEGSFKNIFNDLDGYIQEDGITKFNKVLINNVKKNLSESEKKLSFLSRYFIFRKMSVDEIKIETIFNNIVNNIVYNKYFNKKSIKYDKLKTQYERDFNIIIDEDIWDNVKEKLLIKIIK